MRRSLLVTIFIGGLLMPFALFARTEREIPQRAEERIGKAVHHEILMLPEYNVFDNITYKVEGYNVTLMGEVTEPILKKEAENVVKRRVAQTRAWPCLML